MLPNQGSQTRKTPTSGPPPTKSVIYAALYPPGGTPSISLIPPRNKKLSRLKQSRSVTGPCNGNIPSNEPSNGSPCDEHHQDRPRAAGQRTVGPFGHDTPIRRVHAELLFRRCAWASGGGSTPAGTTTILPSAGFHPVTVGACGCSIRRSSAGANMSKLAA
jgi:hypothetical protein